MDGYLAAASLQSGNRIREHGTGRGELVELLGIVASGQRPKPCSSTAGKHEGPRRPVLTRPSGKPVQCGGVVYFCDSNVVHCAFDALLVSQAFSLPDGSWTKVQIGLTAPLLSMRIDAKLGWPRTQLRIPASGITKCASVIN